MCEWDAQEAAGMVPTAKVPGSVPVEVLDAPRAAQCANEEQLAASGV